jgi:hypothetical protein
MSSTAERLRQIELKVKRAKEHVCDLDKNLRAFFDTNPYEVGAKTDPQTRKLIYYMLSIDPIPELIPLIAGDAIQNLRSSLDYLAYQIVCSDTGDNPPNPSGIYFPIAKTCAKYETGKHGKMQGAGQKTFDAIDALKPYKGGNDLLWILHRLNNIEKHRLLLTVGAESTGINFGQLGVGSGGGIFSPTTIAAFESMEVYIASTGGGYPLKEGFELYIGAADEKPNPKQQFRFDVALNEPGIIEGKSLLNTVHQLATSVEGVVSALTPLLK